MSKSTGNFFTVRDILKEFSPEDVRFFMLSAHYRSPLNFSRDMIAQAHASLTRLYNARDQLLFLQGHAQEHPVTEAETAFLGRLDDYVARFDAAMDDDMNTADALGVIFSMVQDMNVSLNAESALSVIMKAYETLTSVTDVLGLLMQKAEMQLPEDIQALVDARAQARKNKDWKQSDELRAQLQQKGYIVEDTAQGQSVRRSIQ